MPLMAPFVLPAPLHDEYALSPASTAAAADVYDLVVAETSAVLGHCHETAEDVRSWLEPPAEAVSVQTLVRHGATGELCQWWGGVRAPGDPRFDAWIRSHPAVSEADDDALSGVGWRQLLAWVRDVSGAGHTSEVMVHSECVAGDERASRRLLGAGFVHERTFWEMAGPVSSAPTPNMPVKGLSITRTGADLAPVHTLLQEGFAEHWGFEPRGFDDWLALQRTVSGYDETLWWVAELHSASAAIMQLSRRSAAENGLYVQSLATLPAYRHRGIASALLRHAFNVARDEGYDHVVLHVDSDNADGAPGIYQRAGFHVRDAFNAFVLRLPMA
jgi:ribosomal protein S18 acetylase RimI-like enzyme